MPTELTVGFVGEISQNAAFAHDKTGRKTPACCGSTQPETVSQHTERLQLALLLFFYVRFVYGVDETA